MNKLLCMGAPSLVSLLCFATIALASPPAGVTPTLLNRVKFDAFSVKTDHVSPISFEARAKNSLDIVVRQHDYEIGGHTGWHMHPGPVFITVKTGSLTFYEYDDPTCTPIVVNAGEGYVDDGHGHIGVNTSGSPATDLSIIVAPVGGAFRTELSAGRCGF